MNALFCAMSPRLWAATLSPRILVVDDDKSARISLLGALTLAGFQTLSASTIAGAAELLAFQPDVVLVNLKLPDGHGSNLLRRVRFRDDVTAVGLLIPADSNPPGLGSCRPDAVFRKPLDLPDLLMWLTDPQPRSW